MGNGACNRLSSASIISHLFLPAVQCRDSIQPCTSHRSAIAVSRRELILAQYVVGSFACIGGGLFGLDISSMSGVLSVRPV
jgi:hypothetical protein